MENLVFTQLSIPEIRQLLRQELQTFFENKPPATSQAETDLWFDIKEFCNYHPDKPAKPTVYTWVSKEEVPHHKRGKKLYFLKSEIDNWLKAGRKKTVMEIQVEADNYLHLQKKKTSRV